jgi:hypothetical protein
LLGPLLLLLRFLSLLGPLLLLLRFLSLLSPLLLLLRPLLLWLLSPLLLLLLRRALFLFFLRVRRDKRPEKQKQGSRAGNSNELHSNRLLKIAIGCARRRPVRLDSAPPLVRLPLRSWSCAPSHPGWLGGE